LGRNLLCKYDVTEGTSQKDRIKQKYDALESKYESLEALVSELTFSSDDVSLDLLVRLRAGEPIEDILQSLSSGSAPTDEPDDGFSRRDSSNGTDASSNHNLFDHPEQLPSLTSLLPTFAAPFFPATGPLASINGSLEPLATHHQSVAYESKEVTLLVFQPSPTSGSTHPLEQCLLPAVA
jgi:hypothetical protein